MGRLKACAVCGAEVRPPRYKYCSEECFAKGRSLIKRESAKANRLYLKKIGHCTVCGNKDAYTMAGRAMCADCAARSANYARKYYAKPEYRANCIEYAKKYAKDKREKNICITCGHKSDGHWRCPKCRLKINRKNHEKRLLKEWEKLREAVPVDDVDGVHAAKKAVGQGMPLRVDDER